MAKRDVQISISAKDNTAAGLNSAKSALQRFADAQRATQNRRDTLAGAEKSARDAARAYNEAATEAERLGRKLSDAARPSAKLKAEFEGARSAARDAKAEMNRVGVEYAALQGRVAGSRGSFAVFEQTVASLQEQGAEARRTGASVTGLTADLQAMAAAQTRVVGTTTQATAAIGRQGAAARAQGGGDLASRITSAAATRTDRGPLGLRPYELQNLGYQVNDLITQIGSGTPVMQAFAQQGGQIAQLFPGAISAVLRFIPVIAVVSAALAPFIAKLAQVNSEAKTLKELDVAIAASGEGAAYSAPQLAAFARYLDDVGFSADEARDAIKEFVGDSVAPQYIERFGVTAKNLAKVLGIEVVDAAKQVSDAFTGNASDILALDDSLNFLTRAERDHIEALQESGDEAKARSDAFAIFERRYDAAAGKMQGPWTRILRNLTNSWQAFVEYVNFIDFSQVKAEINGLLALLDRLTSRLPGARRGTREALIERREQIDTGLAATRRGLEGNTRGTSSFGGPSANELMRQRDRLLRDRVENGIEIARLAERERIAALPPPSDTTIDPPDPPSRREPRGGGTDKAARDAERLAESQREFVEGLGEENEARAFQVALLSETAREAEILSETRQASLAAEKVGLELTDAQAMAIRQSVGARYDATVAEEAFRSVNQANLELARARGEVETRGAFIARTLAEENLTSEQALFAVRADQLGQLYDIEQAQRDRAASEKTVNDLLTQQAELQRQVQFAQEIGDDQGAAALLLQLDAVNASLLLAVNNAILLQQSLGGPDAAATILSLQGLAAQLGVVGQKAFVTGKQINDMIAGGGATAFDQFAQALVETGNLFGSLRDAFLSFASDFLKQIAQMIVQQAILNALGGGTGGGGGAGGGIASVISALFRHSGGLVGSGGGFRSVNPAAFIGATRYHSGGIAGARPNEVPAILERGEEVLTADDPRHRNNVGAGGANVKIVNVFDKDDLFEKMVNSDSGERVILNVLQRNASAVKGIIG